MNSESTPDAPPELSSTYPAKRKEATIALHQNLLETIQTSGPISFYEFMERCLYDEKYGYYSLSHGVNVGKAGDFFTSVSVGKVFGIILCERLYAYWKEVGSPKNFPVYELGAHTGQLAADILNAARQKNSVFFTAIAYHISEPIESLRRKQRQTLKDFSNKVTIWESSFPATEYKHNVFLSNELIDALPVHVICLKEGKWLERFVNENDGHLVYTHQEPTDAGLIKFCKTLDVKEYDEGYTTEVRSNIGPFIDKSLPVNFKGLFLTIDYGLSRDEYYHRSRPNGTLQGFTKHQTSENFLQAPGSMDITAHVDFTAFANAAESLGFKTLDFTQQGRYLTKWGQNWLTSLENEPEPIRMQYVREFQTLTHPGQLGSSFKVLELIQ